MLEDGAKTINAYVTLPDVLVAIDARPHGRFRIVGVHETDVFEADSGIEPPQSFVKTLFRLDRVAGGKQMRRVDAHSRRNRVLQTPKNGRQLLKGRAKQIPLTRGVFHQHPDAAEVEPPRRVNKRTDEGRGRLRAVAVLGASRVNHNVVCPERRRAFEFAAESVDGKRVDNGIARGEVDQIIRVDRQRPEAIPGSRRAEIFALLG